MKRFTNVIVRCLIFLTVGFSSVSVADVVIGSWNVLNAGWNNQKRFDQLAHVMQSFDFVALQEIMDPDTVLLLQHELETLTGDTWAGMASHLVGRSSRYQEAYAFIWNESKVEYVDGAVTFLDSQDVFAREPFSARFRNLATGQIFAVGTIHVLYGKSMNDRLPVINALADYWQWLEEIYPNTPRLLMGDMNLDANHSAWEPLRRLGALPIVNDGATTLSSHNGRYANQYDHIWATPGTLDINASGKIRFPELFGIDHKTARATISDHAPVWIALGEAELSLSQANSTRFSTSHNAANDEQYGCVDLNGSSSATLQTLPHIGKARAEMVIRGRPWRSASDLREINGIGDARITEILGTNKLCAL